MGAPELACVKVTSMTRNSIYDFVFSAMTQNWINPVFSHMCAEFRKSQCSYRHIILFENGISTHQFDELGAAIIQIALNATHGNAC
jgi:hypothetical protein